MDDPATGKGRDTDPPPPGRIGKGLFADVIVKNPASPHNFTVVSYRESQLLHDMEAQLASNMSKSQDIIPFDDIQLNGYYAVLNGTEWIRGRVEKVKKNENSLWVRLIDRGNFILVHHNQIRRLPPWFRSLPVQARSAHLYSGGQKTLWNSESCQLFRDLTEGKPFCAIVLEEEEDPLENEPSLAIVLVDTSGPKDFYVHKALRNPSANKQL